MDYRGRHATSHVNNAAGTSVEYNKSSSTGTRQRALTKVIPRMKSRNMLGQGQFSIYLPRRVDAEYYVRSPVKVKAEMLLSPENLGGRSQGSIPCRARAEKLTRENGLNVVNVPIKIEAELLLTPGMSFSYKPASPQTPTPLDIHERKSLHMAESWELWGRKVKAALSKYRSKYGVRSENLWETKQVLVSELHLDNSTAKAKELTRQISGYADHVLEQNKRIRLLQARLREEEGGRAESSEKVNIIQQHCKSLERKLKAAESRATGAEHQAEAIKLRTRDLGVVCGHQGVQLKELANQLDTFTKVLVRQKLAALDTHKALEQQVRIQNRIQTQLPSATERVNCVNTSDSNTSVIIKPKQRRECKVWSPFLESAKPEQFMYRNSTVSRLENSSLSVACSSSSCSSLKDQRLTPISEPRHNPEYTEISQNQLRFVVDHLMHLAPNWNLEFTTSLKRAEELVQSCSMQSSKLKDLSVELDCLGTKYRRERTPGPRIVFTEPQAFEIQSDSVESSPFRERPSSEPALRISFKGVTSKLLESSVDKPVFHRFRVLAIAEPALGCGTMKNLVDKSIQTLPPLLSMVETELAAKVSARKCRHQLVCSSSSCPYPYMTEMSRKAAFRRASWPLRYELQMWRLAGRALIQASLLWFGIRLLPQVELFSFTPPPT
ncbi:hypothetical protein R1flu_024594 [Riccia fluitans]|uniref:Uncharacterized protein n=1 Tax=Riccia fluitans TaxID=41844 RepID=A0ABD1XVC4_9MARC